MEAALSSRRFRVTTGNDTLMVADGLGRSLMEEDWPDNTDEADRSISCATFPAYDPPPPPPPPPPSYPPPPRPSPFSFFPSSANNLYRRSRRGFISTRVVWCSLNAIQKTRNWNKQGKSPCWSIHLSWISNKSFSVQLYKKSETNLKTPQTRLCLRSEDQNLLLVCWLPLKNRRWSLFIFLFIIDIYSLTSTVTPHFFHIRGSRLHLVAFIQDWATVKDSLLTKRAIAGWRLDCSNVWLFFVPFFLISVINLLPIKGQIWPP